jgi:TPR repeat protein
MGRCLPIAAALVLLPVLAQAQTARDDAIAALARGEYETAARLLRPLADNAAQPDPAAQFLLAILYDTGRGVGRNMSRACGLFLDAVRSANPLMQHASRLSNVALEEFGPAASMLCVRGAVWPEHPPTVLTLGPNHSVTITDSGTTVVYNGTEHRTTGGLLPGMVAVPARHTPLDVSSPVGARRHFIQSFFWSPDQAAPASQWTLGWMLSEAVGKDLVFVAAERSLATVGGARPPASFDFASVAQVRLNASGEAEWVVSGGTNPRSGIVPWKGPR